MSMLRNRHCTAFASSRIIASGGLEEVVLSAKDLMDADDSTTILIFDDESELVEIDFRLSKSALKKKIEKECVAPNLAEPDEVSVSKKLPPGRPKLGVVAREVTLLPRHWDWLNGQPGGASVTLRKLVDLARKQDDGKLQVRRSQEVTYKFMSAMAGNETGFEEATRALFAGDAEKFSSNVKSWPVDIRNHVKRLARAALGDTQSN